MADAALIHDPPEFTDMADSQPSKALSLAQEAMHNDLESVTGREKRLDDEEQKQWLDNFDPWVQNFLRRYDHAIDLCESSFASRDHEVRDEAERVACELLQNPRLPIAIRAGCHLILASGENEFLEHGLEAVRLYKQMQEEYVGHGHNGDGWRTFLDNAYKLRDRCREDVRRLNQEAKKQQESGWSDVTEESSNGDDAVSKPANEALVVRQERELLE